jgi:hypothetical protein
VLVRAGKLERTAVLKAVCAGFKEGTEPRVCLSQGSTPSQPVLLTANEPQVWLNSDEPFD